MRLELTYLVLVLGLTALVSGQQRPQYGYLPPVNPLIPDGNDPGSTFIGFPKPPQQPAPAPAPGPPVRPVLIPDPVSDEDRPRPISPPVRPIPAPPRPIPPPVRPIPAPPRPAPAPVVSDTFLGLSDRIIMIMMTTITMTTITTTITTVMILWNGCVRQYLESLVKTTPLLASFLRPALCATTRSKDTMLISKHAVKFSAYVRSTRNWR
ncbi:hypothetical protein FHG87_001261 [Trinorchestia longiramus]|nr:hypothetical protein FHG87_001261 [Trinorchestia longiramus]